MLALQLKRERLFKNYHFFLASAILYPVFFIFHFGDLTDTGFHLTNYHFFFENLSEGRINKFTWFSDFLGALWIQLLPAGGILWIKVFYIINFALIVCFSHLILKLVVPDIYKLGPIFLTGAVFSERATNYTFCYDISSWLFSLISIYFILVGIQRNNRFRLALAGFFIMVAASNRIGNAVVLIFLPLFLIYINYHNFDKNVKQSLNRSILDYSAVLCGSFFFFLLVFFAFKLFGLNQIWRDFIFPSNNSHGGGSYTFYNLIKVYVVDGYKFFKFSLLSTAVVFLFSLIYFWVNKRSNSSTFGNILLIVLFFLLAYYFLSNCSYQSKLKFLYPFLLIPFGIFSLLKYNKYSIPLLLFFFFAVSQIAGSNTGAFLKLNYSALLFLPISVAMFDDLFSTHKVQSYQLKRIHHFLLFSLFIFSLISRICYVYGIYETGPTIRLSTNHKIRVDKMKGIYAPANMSQHVENVVFYLKKCSGRTKYLFIYGQQPVFYYLSGLKPAQPNYWMANNVTTSSEVFASLNHNILANDFKPIVLDTKENVFGESGQDKLNHFLCVNDYSLVIDQPTFSIWAQQ